MKIYDINPLCVELSFEEAATIKGKAQVLLRKDIDFRGETFSATRSRSYVGDDFNDETSSIIITGGTWRFYEDANYTGSSKQLGPGYYSWVENFGITNDTISSIKLIAS
ncbi:beta/gamma crystallin family protein [Nostoc cf. edaphicum LEGE 07299]|uniref:Beta/gamma crystallin family protein n=1 Tax=Nostoc cf. edaphicum LEGE 07299 TaxID=2777974 RepID=A0ABR9U4E3_9NOSO|nr:beta/gamma crystallin-related protein [Nostoc edaphicum]MBE9107534.1 beta/gamma crystallin family protein [Nostoc cf. edaphicum LEGE 07299]